MTPNDGLDRALDGAARAASAARELLLRECSRPGGPRGSNGHSDVDEQAELLIRGILSEVCPTWGYLGEETGRSAAANGEGHYWVVDPNDGTSPMLRGYRGHAVSIAAVYQGRPVLGVVQAVDAPDDDGDSFAWAEGCGPIVRNGRPVERFQWPRTLRGHDIVLVSQAADWQPLGNLACVSPARFRSVASVAYRLALVAAGEAAAGVSLAGTCAWDYAAGHALLRASGGDLVDQTGRPVTYAADAASFSSYVFGGGSAVVEHLARQTWATVARSGFGEAKPPPYLEPVRLTPQAHVHDTAVLRRAQGCLLGQLAGDALGSLVEFQPATEIAARYPGGGPRLLEDGGHWNTLAGQPTDDSEMAILLARTLVARGHYDEEAVAAGYGRWFNGWTHAVRAEACRHGWCRPFDYGGTTASALGPMTAGDVNSGSAAAAAKRAAAAASGAPNHQANGALMRASPLGIWGAYRTVDDLSEVARQDARLTHPSRVCQDASAVYVATIAEVIREGRDAGDAYEWAVAWARSQGLDAAVVQALESASSSAPADFSKKQGWVLTALQNAFYRLAHSSTLAEGVIETVQAGGDTDTNAAICGALLGAVYGRQAIPWNWESMVLTCRPMAGHPGVSRPRPAMVWPTDALVMAERLLLAGPG